MTDAGIVNHSCHKCHQEMEINEKWLAEIGGWAAMKSARSIHAATTITLGDCTPQCLRGTLLSGGRRLSTGLLIHSRSNVENLCTCPHARRTGQICDHSLALGLAYIASLNPEKPSQPPTGKSSTITKTPPAVTQSPRQVPGQFSLFLSPSLFQSQTAFAKGSLFLQWKPAPPDHLQDPTFTETSWLASWLQLMQLPNQSSPLHLSPKHWLTLLPALIDHPRIYLGTPATGQHQPLTITDTDLRPLLQMQATTSAEVQISLATDPPPTPLHIPDSPQTYLFHPQSRVLHPWAQSSNPEVRQFIKDLFTLKKITRTLAWLARHIQHLEAIFQVEQDNALSTSFHLQPIRPDIHLHITGNQQTLQLKAQLQFENHQWQPLAPPTDLFPIESKQQPGHYFTPNSELENQLIQHLQHCGLQPQNSNAIWILRGTRELQQFFIHHLPELENRYHCHLSDTFSHAIRHWQRLTPQIRLPDSSTITNRPPSDSGWLEIQFQISAADGFTITRNEALKLIRSGQTSLKAGNGKTYLLDSHAMQEMEQAMQDIPLELTASGARIQQRHQGYFLTFADRAQLARFNDAAADSTSLLPILQQLNTNLPQQKNLAHILRPYQVSGIHWLHHRLHQGHGALLADDMGLGKTLQTLATTALLHARTPEHQPPQPTLIICPKSLTTNWESECQRFVPHLRTLLIQGGKRQPLLNQIPDSDIVITSYQLLVNDLTQHQKQAYRLIVADEASFIRNPDTEIAKALRSLPKCPRLALTGTPVENSVRDLWSIFEFILPGYLGTRQTFQERFEKPMLQQALAATATDNPTSPAKRLRRLIHPYLLRRSKSEVLTDLPEKIEQTLWCHLSPSQAEIYRRILEEGREQIRQARRSKSQNQARMTMFTVLLRLRQTCCDLRLLKLPETATPPQQDELSAKWPLLLERFQQLIENGHKILVFSQFVEYLKLLRQALQDQSIPCAYLDGSSQNRGQIVADFQTNPRQNLFLISLKAGGYGLNLTQADQVFLLDPWWNPAVEAQAIDRAHRFGQNRSVNAYRLITRGTVEERILQLQEKKRGIISSTLDEQSPLMQSLTDQDLELLLQ
jgi:superfamily II DNA or RNA helicase